MEISCPNGANCQGAGGYGTPPKCFLSYSGEHLPSDFRRHLNLTGSILASVAGGMCKASYEVYQCPSCGAKLIFMELETGFGREKKMYGPF